MIGVQTPVSSFYVCEFSITCHFVYKKIVILLLDKLWTFGLKER
jgi:hypothetical protein